MTPKHHRLLRIAKARTGLGDAEYAELIQAHGCVGSSRDLDMQGFDRVMNAFKRLGFRSESSKRYFGQRPGMASTAQIARIRKLWESYTSADNETALNTWLERSFGRSSLRFLTAQDGAKAIQGLQTMLKRKAAH